MILSWNTESGAVTVPNPVVEPGALVINPLTWTAGTERAGVEYNLGSILTANRQAVVDADGNILIVDGFASAQIDPARGVIVCDTVNSADFSLPGFPAGVYHGSDYPFYYINIRMNALLRSSIYLSREQAVMYPSATLAAADAARVFSRQLPSLFDPAATGREAVASTMALASPSHERDGALSFFASPFGIWSQRDGRERVDGYDVDGGGVAVGAYKTAGIFRFGAAAGYGSQRQKMKEFSGRVDADILHTAVFGGTRVGNVFADVSLGYSRTWNRAERNVVFPGFATLKHNADYGQDVWTGRVSFGYVGEVGNGVRIIPELGLDALHARSGTIREKGAAASLNLAASGYTSLELPVSIRVDKPFHFGKCTIATPYLAAAWIPELNGRKPSASGSFVSIPSAGSFTSEMRLPGRTRGRVSAGLRLDTGGRVSLGVDYSLDFARSYRTHTFSASFGLGF